jgi:hypothetical protein
MSFISLKILHFRAGKFIALHGEHRGRRKSEVDIINKQPAASYFPARKYVFFYRYQLQTQLTAQHKHKPASPAARKAAKTSKTAK